MAKGMTKKSKVTNDRLPSKGWVKGKCKHSDGKGCFRVQFQNDEGPWTYHWWDEGGAVLSAMRTSREQETTVQVRDPNGQLFAEFYVRQYDWLHYHQALRFLMDPVNEGRGFTGDIFDIVNKEAARLRREGMNAVLGEKVKPTKKIDKRPKAIHSDIAVDALLDGKKRKPLSKKPVKKTLSKKKVK